MEELLEPNTADSEKPKKSKRTDQNQYPDRVRIDPAGLDRLNQLNEQISGRLKGVKLTRSDLVNFLILSHSETFSASEIKELEAKYFDEVKFAQWALEELKAAKARGEDRTLASILSSTVQTTSKPKKVKNSKTDEPIELRQTPVSSE